MTTCKYACKPEFLSTLSLRRATSPHRPAPASVRISIHALLAESDNTLFPNVKEVEYFYPRSPCGERPPKHEVCRGGINFYPRSPCGERPVRVVRTCWSPYFYPRSPCGERPVRVVRTCWSPYFYPRSPCGERHGQDVLLPAALEFLSTLSLRRATIGGSTNQTHKINFYPRSPCGERLFGNEAMGAGNNNFYPRSPCGERPCPRCSRGTLPKDFYPRSPCGERPILGNPCAGCPAISIHALLAESDKAGSYKILPRPEFLSTLSLRRATHPGQPVRGLPSNFYPRSPCGERRSSFCPADSQRWHFYPRSPCGERP